MHPAAAESLQSRLAMLRSGVVLMGWKGAAGQIVGGESGAPHRLRLFFYRRRGWVRASHRPPWQSAILATHRARGEQGVFFGWSHPTRSWDHARQRNRPSHADECSVSTNTPVSGRANRVWNLERLLHLHMQSSGTMRDTAMVKTPTSRVRRPWFQTQI